MRRWLPLALLVALGALAWLVLRDDERRDPVARATPDAPAVAPVDAQPAEISAQSSSGEQRAELAPAAAEPAGNGAMPDPSLAHLTVRVVGKASKAPVSKVRIFIEDANPQGPRTTKTVSVNRGDISTSPITGGDGLVVFDLPPGRTLLLHARSEDERFQPHGQEFPDPNSVSGKMRVGFDRDLTIEAHDQGRTSTGQSVLVTSLQPGEQRELLVEFEEGFDGKVCGQVVCAETREAVAGARVRMLLGGQVRTEWHTPGPDECTSDNDGRFELPFVVRADPRLCVEAAGYGLRYASLDTSHADRAHPLVILVSRAATLDARVLDASGAPIEGAWIELVADGNELAHHPADDRAYFSIGISFSFVPDEHWRAQTGADGRARLEGLAAHAEIKAAVVTNGKELRREPVPLQFEPGERRELEWRIGSGTTVRGLVVDQAGAPIAGHEIWATVTGSTGRRLLNDNEREQVGIKARTDGAGRFTLVDLPSGGWSIGPAPDEHCDIAPLAELVEVAGEPSLEVTLHVFRGFFVRGRVLDPSGKGAPNCWVNGFMPPAGRPEGVRTEAGGNFVLGPVGPGRLRLIADAPGGFASSDPVQANAGDTGIVLQLKLGGKIRVRVVDGASGAGCLAQVVFAPEDPVVGILSSGMQTSTREDGRSHADGLPPGRWGVTVSTADGRFAQLSHIEVAAGTDSGELVLIPTPGARLRLTYAGARPLVYLTIKRDGSAVDLQGIVERGKPADRAVPAGSLVLELREDWEGPARTRTVELKAGETKEITLTDED